MIPIFIGIIMYIYSYILHFFEEMELSIGAMLTMVLPVFIVFEIVRFTNHYFHKKSTTKVPYGTSIKIITVSLIGAEVIAFSLYIPRKLYEIQQGSNDSIGFFHIASIGIMILIIVLVANAYYQLEYYIRNLYETKAQALTLEKANAVARSSSLQEKISPHFLFNNLNTLYGLIKNDDAKKYLKKLADLYRVLLASGDQELVPLHEEMGNLKNYIYLLQVRFGNLITVKLEVDQFENHNIPPFTLQMLLENAIKHNKISEANPLTVTIKQEGSFIHVRNPINPKEKVISTKIGLNNLKERYILLTNDKVRVENTGSEFNVVVPLISLHD